MFRFALLLRCVLIVALCLDGGTSVWRAAGVATHMGGHPAGSSQGVRADEAAVASIDQDCEDLAATGSRSESTGGRPVHDGCDCSGSGCSCACAFTGIAFTHAVPFAAQHGLAARPAVVLRTQTVRHFSSAVFRPPIG